MPNKNAFHSSGKLTTLLILAMVSLYSCGPSTPTKQIHTFQQDSLQVEQLLLQGDSVYAQRSSVATIAKSLPYFDSANRIAQRLNDTTLIAYTLYYIGNVYNAWNGEPQTTIKFYSEAAKLFNQLPLQQTRAFYVQYLLAHAWDFEKAADSSQCINVLSAAWASLQKLPDSSLKKMKFLPDFAWVATNVKAYNIATAFLQLVPRQRIFNDPESNNYLDHYYLSKARMDIYGSGKKASPYIDSLMMALSNCKNRYDSSYYANNLSLLFERIGEPKASLYYSRISEALKVKLGDNDILSVLRRELLARDLANEREQQRTSAASLRAKNILLIGCIMVALLMVFLYYLYQKRKREIARRIRQEGFTRLLLQKEEDERRRLAADLHDGVNHDLLSLKNNLLQGQVVTPAHVEAVMTTIREVSRNLYPAMFESVGLQASLQALCERASASGFFTSCDLHYKPLLSKYEELQFYRIAQEALNNVAKHAKAEAARISILSTPNAITLEIKDNGKGFDVDKALASDASFGLQSIQQRAAAIDAVLNIKSVSTGTVIFVSKSY